MLHVDLLVFVARLTMRSVRLCCLYDDDMESECAAWLQGRDREKYGYANMLEMMGGTAALEALYESNAIDDATLNAAVALTCLSKSSQHFEHGCHSLPLLKVAAAPSHSGSFNVSRATETAKPSEVSDGQTPSATLGMRPRTPGAVVGMLQQHPFLCVPEHEEDADDLQGQSAAEYAEEKAVSGCVLQSCLQAGHLREGSSRSLQPLPVQKRAYVANSCMTRIDRRAHHRRSRSWSFEEDEEVKTLVANHGVRKWCDIDFPFFWKRWCTRLVGRTQAYLRSFNGNQSDMQSH